MHHKLQNFPPKSDVQNSVVRNHNSTSQAEIASNDAGFASAGSSDLGPHQVSTVETQATEKSELQTTVSGSSSSRRAQTTGRGRPEPPRQKQQQAPTQPRAAVPQVLQQTRCEVARSDGYDPSGENAIACGAVAQVLCEYCGPMCSSCAEETFCFYGEHRYVDLQAQTGAEAANSKAVSEPSQPLFEVIYLELQCSQCDRVRLALPRSYTPDADWLIVCPICARQTTWRYLA